MGGKQSFAAAIKALALAAMIFMLVASSSAADQETILHKFQPGGDALTPQASGVIADAQGNLYGVTRYGGNNGDGAVYELSPQQDGSWTESVLYSFRGSAGDGQLPTGTPVFDSQGNLYGVTTVGGTTGGGTVYKLTPSAGGAWEESIIHDFNCNSSEDGCTPSSSLTFDQAGNLYGETIGGVCRQGSGACGVVFELSPNGGSWTETIIHRFLSGISAAGGSSPGFGMIWDKKGNLYGVCNTGGPGTWGVVWELSPVKGGGQWKETVLWQFGPDVNNPPKGGGPDSSLAMDNAGNLYGAAPYGGGGPGGGGVVYELSPDANGKWTETVIHAFFESKTDSDGMYANSIAIDGAGSLYGTTSDGGGIGETDCGDYQGCGVVFKLTPGSGGKWKESILHRFTNNTVNGDGGTPWPDRLLVDSSGNIFGTTSLGGDANGGIVFEITQ